MPVGLASGIVCRFMGQFAFTVAAAVLVSMFVAFTLTPMLASRFLEKPHVSLHGGAEPPADLGRWDRLSLAWERQYAKVERAYGALLGWTAGEALKAVAGPPAGRWAAFLPRLLLASAAGYGLARFNFRGKEVLFLLLLAPLMIPYQALLTPLYLMFAKLGLANSQVGLAVIHTILQLPFSVYLMRNSFEGIPRELEEAAVMDGSNSWQCFARVALPLVLPGIVTIALFAFITSWNEFLAALIVMNKETAFTVPIMLVSVRTGHLGAVDWGTLQAGIIVSIIPCIAIYVFLQKYYVSGLLSGAVK